MTGTKNITAIFLALIIALITLVSSVSSASPVYYSENGNYYEALYVTNGLTWDEANSIAQSSSYLGVNGHLATITSQSENNFIFTNLDLVYSKTYFIGGSQPTDSSEPDGGWEWVTGERWDYTNWYSGEPNNEGEEDSAGLLTASGEWNDCINGDGYIVEYDKMIWPVPGNQLVSCMFKTYYGGEHLRLNPVSQNTKNEPKKYVLLPHNGIDIPAPLNTRVIAAAEGKVIFSGWNGRNGNLIRIQHSDGYITAYAHLNSISVVKDAAVKQGDTIGFVGNTGASSGYHLHFAVYNENGDFVDPLDFYDDSKLTLPVAVYSQDKGTVESVSYRNIAGTEAHHNGLIVIKDINGETKYYALLNDIYDINVGYEVYPGQLIADEF